MAIATSTIVSQAAAVPGPSSAQACDVQFGFSPDRGGMDLVIALIDSARRDQTVEVAA